MSEEKRKGTRGYGNIYTPHAGSMIIQVQREGGLANRTIVVSERMVRVLRFLLSRTGIALTLGFVTSWAFFAVQTFRVPALSRQIASMQDDARKMDTLQTTLFQLQRRYEQVQRMLGAGPVSPAAAAMDSVFMTVPEQWPLEGGYVTRGSGAETPYQDPHPGVDIAVPVGTEVRAAGGGLVVEIGENSEYGRFVRLEHAEHYETLYAHTSSILVRQGDRVTSGQPIALSGNTGRSTAPHLHFEIRRSGQAVDPMQILQKKGQ
ncbi:MAG TPA: M23 family metallopeptidase [Gemmatimonadaceae bacterium]|nr:M23 family metallopeptidase [Gemmatimonadaceae bacterium]